MTGRERANLLSAWHKQIAENAEDLATLITWENGKPTADAVGEVAYSNSFFQWFAEEAPRLNGQTLLPSTRGRKVFTTREPVGVAGLITPWNFPLAMITRKVGPALAAGCPIVIKSPGETPLTANAMAELALRAGIPEGVVNVVTSLKNTPALGEELCTNTIVKKISFTGSTPVGKLLMKQSSSTLKKLSFELGGNAPLIIFDDADLDNAVLGAIASKFRSSGQTCVCANRIYVQSGIYEAFLDKFAEKVAAFKVGNGFAKGITHGPLIHGRAVGKAESHVQDAMDKGAGLVIGGERLSDIGGNFYAPTILSNVTADMLIAQEETFGPVAGVFKFDSEAQVIKLANDTSVGLAAYFFSQDIGRCYRVADALEVGMVGINTGLISDAASPFGGVKESGFGREGGSLGIEDYTIVKSVTVGGI
jgi:succinate-semialdehyde dehydrogenase/glutarate-semialdehyde dehydrogenase